MSFTPIAPANGISPDHRGGVAVVFTICASCLAFLSTAIRFTIILTKKLGIGRDDVVFAVSWVTRPSPVPGFSGLTLTAFRARAIRCDRPRSPLWPRETCGRVGSR